MLAFILAATVLSGVPTVSDGDTLRIGSERIRIFGIDAPELAQTCGARRCGEISRDWLQTLIAGRPVDCQGDERDQYGRLVARCTVVGQDIGRASVQAGMATAYLQYSHDYAADEAQARAKSTGLWAYGLTSPADYRRNGAGAATKGTAPPDPKCPIKGNINAKGARIYHVPGSRDYAATVIDTGASERWFCSVEDATAAGWRAAGE